MFDFDKFAVVDNLTSVPPDFQSFYAETEEGGAKKFKLQSDNPVVAASVKVVKGLQGTLGKVRGERDTFETQIKGFSLDSLSEFGSSVDEIKANIDSRMSELRDAAGKKIDPVKLREEFAKQHQAEITTRDTKIAQMKNQFSELLIDQQSTSLLSKLTDEPEFVLPIIRERVEVGEADGRPRLFVVDPADPQKNHRHNPATGAPMTLEELVSELHQTPKYARLFNSETRQGPTDPGATKRPTNEYVPPKRDGMTPVGNIAAGLAKGQLGKR